MEDSDEDSDSASGKGMAMHSEQGESRGRLADMEDGADDNSDDILPFSPESPIIHQQPQTKSCQVTTDLEHGNDSDEGPAEQCKSERKREHWEKYLQQNDKQFQYVILQNLPARYNHTRLAQDLVERDENRFAVAFCLPGVKKSGRFTNLGYAFVALHVQSRADADRFLNVFNGWNWKKEGINDEKKCKTAMAKHQGLDPKKGWKFMSEFAGTTTRF